MARTLKTAQVEAQAQNTDTTSQNWSKARRKAVRSFLKRSQAEGFVFTMTKEGEEPIVMGVQDFNNLYNTLNVMSSYQKNYLDEELSLEELVPKLDTSFNYFKSDSNDCSGAE